MELTYVKFTNYRNLGGLETSINRDLNFIVGENNIGKSNFQNGIIKVLSAKPFVKEDFADEDQSIVINLRFHLSDDEIGIFDDLVDPTDSEYINIIARQECPEEYVKYFHSESGEQIQSALIKRINIISYDSLRNPKNEIDFNKTKGAGAFLNYIVKHYVDVNDSSSVLKASEIKKVEKHISRALKKLTAVERFAIAPHIEADECEILSRILFLKDENNISIPDNGYGVQFNLLIMLSLLEKIIDFSKKRKPEEDDFSALLVFDEPEIHLHPYLQRAIMQDIICLANGEDEQFNSLLEEYFGIQSISAQIIVTTHSPNMITDDYEKIIRMYRKNGRICAVSGKGLQLSDSERKQLFRQFEYIKEAVFARAAIVVEGDSEYGSFPHFASLLGIDFNKKGIALLKAEAAESIIPIIKLFNKLGIKSVGVIDNDKKIEKNIQDAEYLFFTKTKCFDSEVVSRIVKNSTCSTLESILLEYDSQGVNRTMQQKKLQSIISKYRFKRIEATQDYRFRDVDSSNKLYEVMYVAWFEINKGILLGKTIGQKLSKKEIPLCYVRAIRKVDGYARIQ